MSPQESCLEAGFLMEIGKSFTLTEQELALLLLGKVGH